MPATRRAKPIYQRGQYRLFPGRPGRALEIVWYDPTRKRERSRSAGTSCAEAARAELDRLYLAETGGPAICPTCGQSRQQGGVLALSAIADYLTMAKDKPSFEAIRARLAHVTGYILDKCSVSLRCDQIDDTWIAGFRKWAAARPIVSPTGKERPRSLSTIENSVLQLRAAIAAYGGAPPRFRVTPVKTLNRTPHHRATVEQLAAMFRFCLWPDGRSDKERDRRRAERANLLSFLRISVATMARPDAALDVSTAPERRQWASAERVLNLNPAGRPQTRKYRATVPIARQMAPILNRTSGFLIPVNSVKSAWEAMAEALDLPGDGESGLKLIRRSVAHIARQRLPEEAWGEVTMFLGHDRFDDVSDLYAPFSPTYLRRALAVIEALIDEIESLCPGAFYRVDTAQPDKVTAIAAKKKPAKSLT